MATSTNDIVIVSDDLNSVESNFMDFSEANDHRRRRSSFTDITVSLITRPQLPADRQTVYEDTDRSAQVLVEMHRFYQNRHLCDVVLRCDTVDVPCHRLVLAASSVYFERMFLNDMSESRASQIQIVGVVSDALLRLVNFAYTSRLTVSGDTVLDTFEAADMLEFPRARQFCEQFIGEAVDVANCLSLLMYADAYSSTALYSRAAQCIAKNFQIVCQQSEFLGLPSAHLARILRDDNVEVEYEEYVYEALKRWIVHDSGSRLPALPELFASIRLNFVSRWYLLEVISNDELLAGSAECRQLIRSAKDQLLAAGHTYDVPWQLPPSRRSTGLTLKLVYVTTSDPDPSESPVLLFDVVNRSWSRASRPCPLASEFSTCATVNGDTLLVIGGWTNRAATRSLKDGRGAVATAHEFRVMSIFPTLWYVGAHAMGISRYLHATVTIGDKVYLFGGYDETQSLQASVFVAEASGGYHFEACRRMLYPVSRPAVASWNGRVFVFGGFGADGSPAQFIQCLDVAAERWTEVRPGIPGGSRTTCEFAVAIEDILYVACGTAPAIIDEHPMVGHRVCERSIDTIRTFHPILCRWATAYQFSESRTGSFSIAALKEHLYITGGLQGGLPCYTIDCFNPRTGRVETIGNASDGAGTLGLCTTLRVMHENFGL